MAKKYYPLDPYFNRVSPDDMCLFRHWLIKQHIDDFHAFPPKMQVDYFHYFLRQNFSSMIEVS